MAEPVNRQAAGPSVAELVRMREWERARGFALHQAALIIPYYAETNPGLVAPARRTVEEILTDDGAIAG